MSILIKGMDMPKNCADCLTNYMLNVVCDCDLNNIEDGRRLPNCPLIEVPPHGRLIDADALRLLYDFNGYTPTGDMTEEEFDRLMCRLPVIRQNIDDMPTIIEAEGEDADI